ncbi:MAG TPA: hypothetical protein VKA94_03510, partial [Hyphomicrobiales bacterium]|nr:hypothetical protein [Hyphomicrobiales bacterium]
MDRNKPELSDGQLGRFEARTASCSPGDSGRTWQALPPAISNGRSPKAALGLEAIREDVLARTEPL